MVDHHEDDHTEGKQIKEEKLKAMKFILDNLRSDNLQKESVVDQLIAANNWKPMMEDHGPHDKEHLTEKLASLEKKLQKAKEAITVEEMEVDRTFHMYSEMLQDRMVITSAIDETSRNLNFISALIINQKTVGKTKINDVYDDIFAKAKLKFEQEEVATNIIISSLEKKEQACRSDRMEAVGLN